jgi:hypothetical protein
MSHFTESELFRLNNLQYNAAEKPYFDPLRYCLRWRDEEPPEFEPNSYERLIDLTIVRSFIHHGRSRENWFVIAPTTYFIEVWDEARERAPNWPGFNRLELSSDDRSFFCGQVAKPLEDHI